MKRSVLLLFPLIILSACTTNPPAKNTPASKSKAHHYHIKTATGQCLQHNTAKHTLSAADCAPQQNQYFAVSGNGIRINGRCLQAHSNHTNQVKGKTKRKNAKEAAVTTAPCTGKPNQNWYREGQTIRSSINGLCLDTSAKSHTLRLLRCNSSQAQQFTFSH